MYTLVALEAAKAAGTGTVQLSKDLTVNGSHTVENLAYEARVVFAKGTLAEVAFTIGETMVHK